MIYKLPSEEFYIEKYVDVFEENEQKEFQEEQKLSCIYLNEENDSMISLNDFTFISKIGQGTFGKVSSKGILSWKKGYSKTLCN